MLATAPINMPPALSRHGRRSRPGACRPWRSDSRCAAMKSRKVLVLLVELAVLDTSASPFRCRRAHGRWHRRSRDRPARAGWWRTPPGSRCRRRRSRTAAAAWCGRRLSPLRCKSDDGNGFAIRRRRHQPPRDIVCGIVPARDFLALAQPARLASSCRNPRSQAGVVIDE